MIRCRRGIDFVIHCKRKGGSDGASHREFVFVENIEERAARVRAKL